jgi:Xaa-Pro aminopeptidase
MNTLQRINALQQLLQQKNIDAVCVEEPVNLYYLTGMDLSAGKLVVARDAAYLLVDGRYYEACQHKCPVPTLLSVEGSLRELFKTKLRDVKTLVFSKETTAYSNYLDLKETAEQIKIHLEPETDLVRLLRQIKDPEEIERLRNAAKLGSEGFDTILTLLREGISEEEVASELEIFWKRKGGKKTAFDPIIAFGKNASQPHYRAGTERLKKGQGVLIDIGVTLDHYHSDMTRVVFYGEPDPQLREIYHLVAAAQEAALNLCRPGTTLGELDAAARETIASKGYGEAFTHSLGHGIGLDVHEFPTIRNKPPFDTIPLAPGMAITIEPGIYLPGLGGVRIEDTVLITSGGYEDLTQRPKKLVIL